MDSGGMLPSSPRSCTFIWARWGFFFCENRLKFLVTQVDFGGCFCEEVSFSFSGGMPSWSRRELFKKEKNFFLSPVLLFSDRLKKKKTVNS